GNRQGFGDRRQRAAQGNRPRDREADDVGAGHAGGARVRGHVVVGGQDRFAQRAVPVQVLLVVGGGDDDLTLRGSAAGGDEERSQESSGNVSPHVSSTPSPCIASDERLPTGALVAGKSGDGRRAADGRNRRRRPPRIAIFTRGMGSLPAVALLIR